MDTQESEGPEEVARDTASEYTDSDISFTEQQVSVKQLASESPPAPSTPHQSEQAELSQQHASSATEDAQHQGPEPAQLSNSCVSRDRQQHGSIQSSPVLVLTQRGSLRRSAAICMQRFARGFLVRKQMRTDQSTALGERGQDMVSFSLPAQNMPGRELGQLLIL